eukprot:257869_1
MYKTIDLFSSIRTMSMDWRSLPAIITSPTPKSTTTEGLDGKHEGTQSSKSTVANDMSQHYLLRHDIDPEQEEEEDVEEDHRMHDDDDTPSSSESNEKNNNDEEEDEENEEGLSAEELRRKVRRGKHIAKIREVYADYLSDGSTTTNSSATHSTSNNDSSHDTNLLQTVRYRAPRRTRGCPHWRIGCKFEGDEASLSHHLMNDCCFEKMKGMIKKRDHQISALQSSCASLQHQVHQLHSLLSSFMSLQTPQLQSYLMSHLPNDIVSTEKDKMNLNRNLSSELYDAPHNAINLSLHSLDEKTRPLAYQRREVNREMIHKHEMSIGGTLGLIWRSLETIIGYNEDDDSSLLNPTVNYINNAQQLTLNNTTIPPNISYFDNVTQKKSKKDVAVRSLILFWNKVISTSNLGIQIWDILSDNGAKIQGLSHNGWLFNESSFGLATQAFSHPYWLFTGHKQEIRVWKYNGFSFNTSCSCNACCLMFGSEGYGDVRCIAVSDDHIFASSDSNIIQFWKFTETDGVVHASQQTLQDKRINAVGHIEYLGNLVCGHRGMITSLKVFGDVLISGSKDGFVTIWSATQLVNLSILHYGDNPVLDFTIFPNPYPLCHMTIWNEHLHALKTRALHEKKKKKEVHDHGIKSVIQYVSLNSLYDEIPKQEQNTIHDTILGFCGHTDHDESDIDMLNTEDAPAAIPSSSTSSAVKKDENRNSGVRVLSREIMHRASLHFASIALIVEDLKLIVGGRSGEIHIWHIGTTRDVFNSTTTWERETTLRGHGDIVTCLASFGTHLLSAYSNGSIKLWKWDKSELLCTGTAYTDPVKRVGSADSNYSHLNSSNSCTSVRRVLLLPSPTLNLNHKSWSLFDEEENMMSHDDDDDDSFNNEFNVKISAPHHASNKEQRRKRKRKRKKKKEHKNKMNNNEFWVLSGTSNGSMLLHQMDYL